MYKSFIDIFKRNAQKRFEENIAKSSIENSKRGKNMTKLFIFFQVVDNKHFLGLSY